ncbi:spermine oxidase-like [Tubulanus polymorphus]|uniref:spermine oxidase-like n=1 Tax=Tubulanus polymorphus TaxID=672921 RepID=UPI003DA1E590
MSKITDRGGGAGGKRRDRVLVIGAGMAGLSTASELFSAGFKNVTVLEAQDRPGGRIKTLDPFGETHIEIGAQWVHGQHGNPIFHLADKMNLVDLDGMEKHSKKISYYYTENGERVEDRIVDEIENLMESLFEAANDFHRKKMALPDGLISVGDFFRRGFNEYLDSRNDTPEILEIKKGLYKWRLLWENGDNACNTIDELSLKAWGEFYEFAGEDDNVLKTGGYQPIIDHLLENIDKDAIVYNKPVKTINWCLDPEADSRVSVVCKDGCVYKADYVVSSVSIGVTRENIDTLFQPVLPTWKTEAMSRIGFGVVDKIFLEFEERFWEEQCEGIHLVWLDDGTNFNLECYDPIAHNEKPGHEWYRGMFSFDGIVGQPKMLMGWISGHEARKMEECSNEEVKDVCLELIRRFTDRKSLPKLKTFHMSRWFTEPYVRGSYSYCMTHGTPDDADTYALPLPNKEEPKLMFAGEATNRNYFSTVHGAHLSGIREAQRIIEHHKRVTS